MPKDKLAEELIAVRRQIAMLKSRAKEIEIALSSVPQQDRNLRPGWPIRRSSSPQLQTHLR